MRYSKGDALSME